MNVRSNILPEPRFAELKDTLAARLAQVGASLHAGNFRSLIDSLMLELFRQGLEDAKAHEGTIWLPDEPGENLVPAFNTGPHAGLLVGKFKQPLNAGLICMVFANEQPFVENEVYRNSRQSKLLDRTLGVQTYALIAVPLHFLGACRGVVSCVQLKNSETGEADPPGFSAAALKTVQCTATTLSRLIELRLISITVGLSSE